MLHFSIQNAHGKRERVISCAAGCGLTVSWSERSRNGLGSVAHCKWRFSCFQQISVIFWMVTFHGRRSIFGDVGGWDLLHPAIVNSVSCVKRINHESDFSWQTQYLVTLEGGTCWHLLLRALSKEVSYLNRINHESDFSWQGQNLVKLHCHFSWQAQYLVKYGMIAGARNVVFFHTKCAW